LSIAKVFAKNGANILINGFGDRTAIDKLVADLSSEYGVKVFHLLSHCESASMLSGIGGIFFRRSNKVI
jgi:3-hydroxybutyrate dehydrogenase